VSHSAVPLRGSGVTPVRAALASVVPLENRVNATGWRPNAITSIRSEAAFVATKVRAAAVASASFAPAIDCDRSTASTTLFARPRLVAWKPATGIPFSCSRGFAAPSGATTVTRTSG